MKRLLIFLFFISFYGNSQYYEQKSGRKVCEAIGRGFSSETIADEALEKILSTIGTFCNKTPMRYLLILLFIPFISFGQENIERYKLYPTQNMWNFLLIDVIDGDTYQVQWNPSDIQFFKIEN